MHIIQFMLVLITITLSWLISYIIDDIRTNYTHNNIIYEQNLSVNTKAYKIWVIEHKEK